VLVGALAVLPSAGQQQADPVPADSLAPTPPCTNCIHGPRIELAAALAQDTSRHKAIEYSSAYGTRLTIHRIASYAALPLFAAEYFVGTKVLNDEQANPAVRSSSRGLHSTIATGLEALFAVNTVTGVWNLVEARHDPAGRARRWIHSLAMLAADGGFVATASAAGSARGGGQNADQHRSLALASMGVATAATVMMWLWKD
jgi:hypothetical protein